MVTPHHFFAVVLRLFSTWLFMSAGQIILLNYALLRTGQGNPEPSFVIAGLYLIVAILLWRYPLFWLKKIMPASDQAQTANVGDAGITIAFVSAGLAIIALKAVTPVANYVAMLAMLMISGQYSQFRSPTIHIDGLIGIAMLAIGLMLIVKSRSFAMKLGHRPK